jgi:hypothetical protein
VIIISILMYTFGVQTLLEAKRGAEEGIALKKKMVMKYEEYLQTRKVVEEELAHMMKEYEGVQQRLLPGETSQIGAANL